MVQDARLPHPCRALVSYLEPLSNEEQDRGIPPVWHHVPMPKRSKHPKKRRRETNRFARELVAQSARVLAVPDVWEFGPSVSDYLAAIGRRGGLIGGKRRMKTMTATERQLVAKKAAKARWRKSKKTT
jgi:hypothetical protein